MAKRKARAEGEAVIHALTHWLRREILRCLQLPDVAVSPKMLEDALGVPLSNCNYHLLALAEDGLAEEVHLIPIRGAAEHFYVSKVRDNALVQPILDQTAEEDKARVETYQKKRAARQEAKAAKSEERGQIAA